jgi:hypothetical protein
VPKKKKTKTKKPVVGGTTKPAISKATKRKKLVPQAALLTTAASVRKFHRRSVGVVTTLDTDTVRNYRSLTRANSTATVSQKRKASEAMGESGAVAYLNDETGEDLDLFRPKKSDPFDLSITNNDPWSEAVAFNGAGVSDVVHWDGTSLYVVEAKGGNSALKPAGASGRMRKYYDNGDKVPQLVRQSQGAPRLSQGTIPYLMDIAYSMQDSTNADGRSEIGRAILSAAENGTLRYVPVSTKIEPGDTEATVSVMPSE